MSCCPKKKLCYVATVEFAVLGFLKEHIRVMADDYDVHIIVTTDNPDFLLPHNIAVTVTPVNIERAIAPFSDLKTLYRLYKIYKHEKFDIVHSITPKAGLLSTIAGCLSGCSIRVHTFTGQVWAVKKGLMRTMLKAFDKIIAALATNVLVDSASQLEYLVRNNIVGAEKAQVLANGSICGVDTRRFNANSLYRTQIRQKYSITETAILFLFVGRLKRDKGVLDLIQAFHVIHARCQNTHLLLVGPDEDDIKSSLNSDMTKTAISVEGYSEKPEAYMSAADIFCLPSYREGFGNVIIEAAATGIPSIGSRVYGITDAIVENVTGLLHEPGDVAGIVDVMHDLITDVEKRLSMGERAKKRAREKFSSYIVINALSDYYKCLQN